MNEKIVVKQGRINMDKAIFDKVYNAKDHEILMDAYKDWAGKYDSDLAEEGYVAPAASAAVLDNYLEDKNAYILDAGCGTGLVGELLAKAGYKNQDALDYSKEMLDEAAKKGVYKKLLQADMTKPLEIADDTYDAIICVGTFTYGHVGPDAFGELIRVTRNGGYICFTVREGAYEEHDYRKHMLKLEGKGCWELEELREADYIKGDNVTCKVCLYRVAK
ncbi:MAG: class I SAM-dependent DNA methyltransferase [Oceanidesulfovibrio sp.]